MIASRVRYKVLAFGVALGAITYMDRIAISITSKQISHDLALTDQQMSYVFSAFTLAYGLFEIPTGWWGDKVGTRSVLMRIVTWWSLFTMLTAAAWSFGSLLVVRFLFGMGEAGAWPNSAKTFSRWFPKTERGRAQGIFFMGAHGGGAYSPLLIAWMLTFLPWRMVFVVLGSVGFVWAFAWYRWFRSEPGDHPEVNAAELALIMEGREAQAGHGNVPWWNILKDRNVLLLCVMYFVQTYGFYFYLTWMPTYLERVRGFKATDLGLFAGAPMVACMVADLTGGIATDAMTKRFGLRLGRTIAGGSGFVFAGLFTILGAGAADPTTAALYLALGAGWGAFCLAAGWGTCLDISGPHAGVVGAVMNTAGQIGGFLSPIVLAYLIRETGDWNTPLNLTGVLLLIGAVCWIFINPTRKIALH